MWRTRIVRVIWVTALLAGCGAPKAGPAETAPAPSADAAGMGCTDAEYSAGVERIGVRESTDRGATWTFLGHACFHGAALVPVDPAPVAIEGRVALYFLDLLTLRPESEMRVIYRATTTNGVDFDRPEPAFTTADFATDPFVLRLAGGDYRIYLHGAEGLITGRSSDGMAFTRDEGVRIAGAVPGALLLPDGRVRLFTSGPEGISSSVSPDGLEFAREEGVRIPPAREVVDGPHPIRLGAGGYLMAYNTGPRGRPQEADTVLATSADGLNWENATTVPRANMPGLVEREDGSLLLYYVDFNYPGAGDVAPAGAP